MPIYPTYASGVKGTNTTRADAGRDDFAAMKTNRRGKIMLGNVLPDHLQHGQGQLLSDDEVSHEAGQAPCPPCGAVVERLQRVPERHLKRKPCGARRKGPARHRSFRNKLRSTPVATRVDISTKMLAKTD